MKNNLLWCCIIEFIAILFLIADFVLLYDKEETVISPIRKHDCIKETVSDEKNFKLFEILEFESDFDGYINSMVSKYVYEYSSNEAYQIAKSEPKADRYSVEFNDDKLQVILIDDFAKLTENRWYVSFAEYLQDEGYVCELVEE